MGLAYRNGRLFFGDNQTPEQPACDLWAVAKTQTGPFYLYDLDGMRARVRKLRQAYSGLQVHYAFKANGSPRILRTFRQEGTGIDVVSAGEIRLARKSGFEPNNIIFSGVGKTKSELELAIGLEIKQINVESPQELVRIIQIARALQKKPKIAFRLNPDVDAKTHPYITTGFRENKFGMGEHFFPELRALLKGAPVELQGLTLHIGSQLMDLSPIESAISIARKAFESFEHDGHKFKTLDVGGGVGISYKEDHAFPANDLKRIEEYGGVLQRALKGFEGSVLCEPGRILVGSCGVLVGEVQYVKETPFRNFLILNTGMHHLMRPALYQAHHRILPVYQNLDRQIVRYDVVGPICESSDVLGKERELQKILQGEFVAIADSGAYGRSMASNYNEHEMPEELFWENGTLTYADESPVHCVPNEAGKKSIEGIRC